MQGHVSILSVSPEAAAMIASGGRISTMDGTADEIYANSLSAGQEKNEKLIGKVLSSGHTSVLEHCYVNLSFGRAISDRVPAGLVYGQIAAVC